MASDDNLPPSSMLFAAEIAITDLIRAQRALIHAQVKEITDLWKQVRDLHQQKLSAESERKELAKKYSQLRLEAWLNLAKVAMVVVAVAFVLWAKFDRLPEVLKALPRAETPSDRAGKPTDGPPAATPKTPHQIHAK